MLPVHDTSAVIAGHVTTAAIALMFFLHGARLAPKAALAGARHWRLHVVVLASTFLVFPALALAARALFPHLLTAPLWTGLILLSVLPSTVQSSIAFTSIARGNVPAALCAATASNLLGMVLTPLLAGLLLSAHGGFSIHGVGDIVVQLLLPFAAGQLARPLIGAWAQRNKTLLGLVDRGSILLVVYAAFSEGVTQGIWHQLALRTSGGWSRSTPRCWQRSWPSPPSAADCWVSPAPMRSPSSSADPKRAWRAACRWQPSCSPVSPPA